MAGSDHTIQLGTIENWEDAGSWATRDALAGGSIRKRLEAIRLAIVERCRICGIPTLYLAEPFCFPQSIFEAVREMNGCLQKLLKCFIAVDDGRIRVLKLYLPDGTQKTWHQCSLKEFTAAFECGSLEIREGKVTLTITLEGRDTDLPAKRIFLDAVCYSESELTAEFPVFLPDCDRLSLLGDWIFQVYGLLKKLVYPAQELDLKFYTEECTGQERGFTRYAAADGSATVVDYDGAERVQYTGTLSEAEAWENAVAYTKELTYAVAYRFREENVTDSADLPFSGAYDRLEVGCCSWTRRERNDCRRTIVRTGSPLPVSVCYQCEFGPDGETDYLADSSPLGSRKTLFEGEVDGDGTFVCSSDPITLPGSGTGTRSDQYRIWSIRAETVYDHCGLVFV